MAFKKNTKTTELTSQKEMVYSVKEYSVRLKIMNVTVVSTSVLDIKV